MPDPSGPVAAILTGIRETIAACLDPRTGPNVMLMHTMAKEAATAAAAVEKVLELHQPGCVTILGSLCRRGTTRAWPRSSA